MSEEKKNLTEEERKELKEKMKKQIDEMSDEELDNLAGGAGAGVVEFETRKCKICGLEFLGTKNELYCTNCKFMMRNGYSTPI